MLLTESQSFLSLFLTHQIKKRIRDLKFHLFQNIYSFFIKPGFLPTASNWELKKESKSPTKTVWERSSIFNNFMCENNFLEVLIWLDSVFALCKLINTKFSPAISTSSLKILPSDHLFFFLNCNFICSKKGSSNFAWIQGAMWEKKKFYVKFISPTYFIFNWMCFFCKNSTPFRKNFLVK